MLKIIGRANSSNVQKVLWCCAELGLAYAREDAGREFGRTDSEEFAALNPNRLVPVLVEDGFVLWESNAIVRYLAAKYGAGTLYPDDLRLRAGAERWMDWQLGTLGPAFTPMFHGLVRSPPEARDAAAIEASRAATERLLAIVDAWLADRAYLAGDAFTIGDIPLGIYAYRWYRFEGIRRKTLPALARWYDSLAARPAFRAHVMVGLA